MAIKILVVDDDPEIVKLLKSRLEFNRYEVIIAIDGEEAIDKARQDKPDLIILDVMLPQMDGNIVARILKSDRSTNDIPIIMFTAGSQTQDMKTGIESGVACYMQKRFNPQILLGMIPSLIKDKKKKKKSDV